MRKTTYCLMACIMFLCFIPVMASAQATLVSPSNGAELNSPPDFSWTEGGGDLFLVFLYFYYNIPSVHTGYFPHLFWSESTGFPMNRSWWDLLGEDKPSVWAIFGYNTATEQGEWSAGSLFTKIPGCDGQCKGAYTRDCNPTNDCICFTTTEESGVCVDDFYCSNASCNNSDDCGTNSVCITCSFCNGNRCAVNQCTDGGPHGPAADDMSLFDDLPTASGR